MEPTDCRTTLRSGFGPRAELTRAGVEAAVAAGGVDVAAADAEVAADSRRMPEPVLPARMRVVDAVAAAAAVAEAGDAGEAARPSEYFQHLY
jgi:hypothetical protein